MPARKSDVEARPYRDVESALVARIRAGDERAFESLYVAHHDALWRFALGMVRIRAVAEEIVQDVFLALWCDRAEWVEVSSVRAWLYGATRHHALNHLRHRQVVTRFTDSATHAHRHAAPNPASEHSGMGAPPPDAHEDVEMKELDRLVTEAIAGLSERRKVAMTLRWKHDLGAAEIAHVLGTTPEAVRVLLSRSRQDLAALLDRIR